MGVKIDCDIPGGNIIVLSSNENGAVLKKDLRDTSTDWFYWCFRAAFDKAGEYEFRFEPADSPAVGSRGPAVSMDNGMTWRWAEAGTYDVGKNTFRYRYDGGRENQVVFCLSMQYQEKNLNAFLKEYAKSPYLETSILCKSNKGRDVELIHIAGTARKPEKKLFLSSRHHCCEMTATYVLEGILREALENREFREAFEVFAVPFADRDGVVDGDQGKNRRPHDHARDYGDNPIYSETANIMKLVRQGRRHSAAVRTDRKRSRTQSAVRGGRHCPLRHLLEHRRQLHAGENPCALGGGSGLRGTLHIHRDSLRQRAGVHILRR